MCYTLLYYIYYYSPLQFASNTEKREIFSSYLRCESHMKVTDRNKMAQMNFSVLIKYFENTGYINVYFSEEFFFNLFAIKINLFIQLWRIFQQEIPSMKIHNLLLTRSIIRIILSINGTSRFFYLQIKSTVFRKCYI